MAAKKKSKKSKSKAKAKSKSKTKKPAKKIAKKKPAKKAAKQKAAPKQAAPKTPQAAKLKVREMGPQRFAALVSREQPPNFGVWNQFMPLAKERDLAKPGAAFAAPHKARDLTGPPGIEWYAAAVTVGDDVTLDAPLEEVHLPKGKYVTTIYEGAYDGMGNAWMSFVTRLRAEGHQPELARPCLEIYLEMDPTKTPRTELCVPVA